MEPSHWGHLRLGTWRDGYSSPEYTGKKQVFCLQSSCLRLQRVPGAIPRTSRYTTPFKKCCPCVESLFSFFFFFLSYQSLDLFVYQPSLCVIFSKVAVEEGSS